MTKQVPSKNDTAYTVFSILPLATFHQRWPKYAGFYHHVCQPALPVLYLLLSMDSDYVLSEVNCHTKDETSVQSTLDFTFRFFSYHFHQRCKT